MRFREVIFQYKLRHGVKVKKNSHAAQKNGYEIIEGEYSPGQKLIKPIAVWVYLILAFCPKIVYNQINILAVINLSVSVNY